MAEWNTPARNAAIKKRPCDQKTRWVFRDNIGRENVARPTCTEAALRSSLMDVLCGSRASVTTFDSTAGVPQIASDLVRFKSWSR